MLKPKFKMYQEVVLVRGAVYDDLFGGPVKIRKGQEGVVVLINITAGVSYVGYEVEFFDSKGETIAVSTVKETDLAILPGGHPGVEEAKPRRNRSRSRAA